MEVKVADHKSRSTSKPGAWWLMVLPQATSVNIG
jgi:hypothetical protein